jgi:hypothetical protein
MGAAAGCPRGNALMLRVVRPFTRGFGVWVLCLAACGDDGSGGGKRVSDSDASSGKDGGAVSRDGGASSRDGGAPSRDGGPTSSDRDAAAPGDGGGASASLREVCVAACTTHASCLGLTTELCESDCEAHAQTTSEACEAVATTEQACLLSLSCDEAKAYATQGRRNHPRCGAAARAYFEACTVGAGTIPAACQALCARYETCGALDVARASCEESCTLQATNYRAVSGGCSDAFLGFMQCAAGAGCEEVRELAENQLAPLACEDALDALQAACE